VSTWLLGLTLLAAAPAVDDDRDVIQTSMLSFFKHEEWHAADWKPKDFVVLNTQFRPKSRREFTEAFQGLLKAVKDEEQGWKDATEKQENAGDLDRLRRGLADLQRNLKALEGSNALSAIGDFQAPPLRPLKQREWDKRIKVTDGSNRVFTGRERADTNLERWTVYGTAAPPSYSSDGHFAIAEFHIPWSIHSSHVTFFLEREPDGWKIKASHAAFYV